MNLHYNLAGTCGSCVRALHGLNFMIIIICSIVLIGCGGRSKIENPANAQIIAYSRDFADTDTAILHIDKAMAKRMYDFVLLMKSAHPDATAEALKIFINGIKDDRQSLRSASNYAYRLLANPNSPLRSEEQYIEYLEAILNNPGIPEDIAETTEERLRRVSLNREGTIANDFQYIDRKGNQGRLHLLKAPQTMLIFYDPECPHCPEILQRIASDRRVNERIEAGLLKVLAVYTEGKRDLWDDTKDELPANWTVAYDLSEIVDKEIYDIPAMPTVYLLNEDKRVLIKDMPW